MATMTDPYRTPAVVETDEQRVERLRNTYYNIGAMNTPTDPAKRAEAMSQLETARGDWMRAAARLSYATVTESHNVTREQFENIQALFATMHPAPTGAGRDTP